MTSTAIILLSRADSSINGENVSWWINQGSLNIGRFDFQYLFFLENSRIWYFSSQNISGNLKKLPDFSKYFQMFPGIFKNIETRNMAFCISWDFEVG